MKMKLIKIGRSILIVAFLYYFIYNAYFGWNLVPMSETEETCDKIARIFFNIGFIIYIIPIFRLYEDAVQKREDITTKDN
jgi:uncharacterized membrane protein